MGRGDKTIDPERDPEGYARYLKEREERFHKERREKKAQEEREARLNQIKVSGTQEFKVGAQVMVVGLQKCPEKNGAIGTLFRFITEKDRWQVEFANGSSNNFKVENLQVVEDTTAKDEDQDDSEIPTAKLYVSNVSRDTTAENLISLFGGIGVLAKEPIRDNKGRSKGYQDEWPFAVKVYKPGTEGGDACVEYMDKFSAKAAIKAFHNYTLQGNVIGVDYAGSSGQAEGEGRRSSRSRSRSRERLRQLAELKKGLDAKKEHPLLAGIFERKS